MKICKPVVVGSDDDKEVAETDETKGIVEGTESVAPEAGAIGCSRLELFISGEKE